MPRLSIIIPCLGSGAEFDGTLVSVLQNRPADCEVLVAHSEPYNDPYNLCDEVHFVQSPATSLVELLNVALDSTSGEIVHTIGCGLEARECWTGPALEHFDDPEIAAVSPVVLAPDQESVLGAGVRWSLGGARHVMTDQRVVARGSGRLRAKILGPMLTAAFYRRDVLVALGGFETQLGDRLADVGMALAIRSLGRLHIAEPASQLLQAGEIEKAVSTGLAEGRSAERLFFRSAVANGWLPALACHALSLFGEAFYHAPRASLLASLAGRAAAWLEFGAAGAYEQRLVAASARLTELAELRASIRKPAKRTRPKSDPVIPRRRAA